MHAKGIGVHEMMELTPQQKQITEIPVGDILISAAAGSGKTSVMTERIVQRIRAHELDIGKVLVMTFTEAAARNMRDKIDRRLRELLNSETNSSERDYLASQISRLSQCSISTIHAFCLEIVKNFHYEAHDDNGKQLIEPGFRIEDTGESNLLLAAACDRVLEDRYLASDISPETFECARFLKFADTYGSPKNNDALRSMLSGYYRYIRSMPDYVQWMESQKSLYLSTISDFENSVCFAQIRKNLTLCAAFAEQGLDEFCEIIYRDPQIVKDKVKNALYIGTLRNFASAMECLLNTVADKGKGWDDIYEAYESIPDIKFLINSKAEGDKLMLRSIFKTHFAELLHIGKGDFATANYKENFLYSSEFVFYANKGETLRDMSAMYPMLCELFDLLLDVDKVYTHQKRISNMIDFGDFEHLALRILRTGSAGKYFSEKYSEIYIDEYQDTSSIQEAIINIIANNNLFMVGDVKQSIYKFRHAKPEIFMSKMNLFKSVISESIDVADGGACGKRIPVLKELNKNFRSLDGILAAVNGVFFQLMSSDAGEVDYSDGHALVASRTAEDENRPQVEMILVDISGSAGLDGLTIDPDKASIEDGADKKTGVNGAKDSDETNGTESDETNIAESDETNIAESDDANIGESDTDSENKLSGADQNAYTKEARVIAAKISDLLTEGYKPADIAVLARTRNICDIFADALDERGIPCLRESGASSPDYYEVKVIESFINVLDNPKQDIPLACLMRSGFIGPAFSEEELLDIRLAAPKTCRYFYECCEYINDTDYDEDKIGKPGNNVSSLNALGSKIRTFYEMIGDYRSMCDYLTPGEIVEKLFKDSGILAYAASMQDGAARLRYLHSFSAWAHKFCVTRHTGVFELVRYYNSLKENLAGESPFPVEDGETDRIRVMTVHKSKGLEYPIVFVAGLSRKLRGTRVRSDILLSESAAPGLMFVDYDRQFKYQTPAMYAQKVLLRSAELAEEMRLLYVAMTRAKERLIVSGYYDGVKCCGGTSGIAATVERARRHAAAQPLPAALTLAAASALDWLVLALARNPHADFGFLGVPSPVSFASAAPPDYYPDCWTITRSDAWRLAGTSARSPGESRLPPGATAHNSRPESHIGSATDNPSYPADGFETAEYANMLRKKFIGTYPYKEAMSGPLKLATSEIKRHETEEELAEYPSEIRGINTMIRQTDGQISGIGTGKERGIAIHNFIRYADYNKLAGKADYSSIKRHLNEMKELGMIKPADSEMILPIADKLAAYFNSTLAREILIAGNESTNFLFREMPFTISVDCKEFYGSEGFGDGDTVLIQGIIDCWYIKDNKAVLIDYKTDRLTGSSDQISESLKSKYATQLSIYAKAIRDAYGIEVNKAIIWHIPSANEYKIDINYEIVHKNPKIMQK